MRLSTSVTGILASMLILSQTASANSGMFAQQFNDNGSPSLTFVPAKIAKSKGENWGEKAQAVIQALRNRYGIDDAKRQMTVKQAIRDWAENHHVKLQQQYKGIDVEGGELIVHFKKGKARTITGMSSRNLNVKTTPTLSEDMAHDIALDQVARDIESSPVVLSSAQNIEDLEIKRSRLVIYNKSLVRGAWKKDNKLAYKVVVVGAGVREFVYIDADNGRILDTFSGIHSAKKRMTYDAQGREQHDGAKIARSEAQANVGDSDVDDAHNYAGDTYDYFLNAFGRDSIDDKGMDLLSFVHYGQGFQNAYWDGQKMTYGDGFPVQDVAAHELTHGITEKTAGLVYKKQSGALNESYSDIFGETVDQLFAGGNDSASVKWEMGEDVPDFGTLRDLSNPPRFQNADKVTSNYYYCGSQDNGGVHLNSGVPNKNYYLLVAGGNFNGRNIEAIGMTKAAAIHYVNLTNYAGRFTQFSSHFIGLWRACRSLKGMELRDPMTGSGSAEVITDEDCNQVVQAGKAVEFFTRACRR